MIIGTCDGYLWITGFVALGGRGVARMVQERSPARYVPVTAVAANLRGRGVPI